MSSDAHLLWLLGLGWAGYGLLHSLTASLKFKAWFRSRFPRAWPAYRLGYNLLSALLLLPLLWLLGSWQGPPLWQWPGAPGWLMNGIAVAALAGFVASLRLYQTGEFLGLAQLRRRSPELHDQAPLRIAWPHRYVRHPWYFLGLLIIWTREMHAAWLVTAVVLTLYLVIGSRLEEKKLIECHGERYRRYRDAVPGLVPLPWRYLSKRQAAELCGAKPKVSEPGPSAR